MKVAVYTLTRDRLDYTRHCLESLRKRAGYPYDHFIVDNGSTDGTQDWLLHAGPHYRAVLNGHNTGISRASNAALDLIEKTDHYDLIVKVDNDCEVVSENILGQIAEMYTELSTVRPFEPAWVLSPRVEGINRQPSRSHHTQIAGRRVGVVGITGGLFQVIPAGVLARYRYPETLPLAKGQDDHFAEWFRSQGGQMGYVEDLVVNHYETTDGQAQRYPAYFERKFREEKLETP